MTVTTFSLKHAVVEAFFAICEEGLIDKNTDKETIIELVMRELGINVHVDAPEKNNPCWLSHRCDRIHNGQEFTLVGELLSFGIQWYKEDTQSWDWLPVRPAEAGEREDCFIDKDGCTCAFLVPAYPRLADDLVEVVHLFLVEEMDCLLLAWEEALIAKKKYWGQQINKALSEAGCSPREISAWWRMHWKKEWSPGQWVGLLNTVDKEALNLALHTRRHDELKRLIKADGAFHKRSMPRKQDAIKALAWLYNVNKAEYKKTVA